ncbi:T9SS type A sorting domain-containing protein [Pontibacter sp. G13]|uniref:T9SS type A sorting domain-containing protein n=1 Tax=Pontibacter sp. G13 TaxID=3074898 RepID=UPI00288BD6DE|nr:T9SS type A sorting domain-containing protein [Pontibacter sp. G13]WNJ20591.1 T9SS type A sorting domain-containing protein [Pontibacter sp. G13]
MKKTTTLLLGALFCGVTAQAQIALEPGVQGTMTELTPANTLITTEEQKPGLQGKNMVTTSQYVFFIASDTVNYGEELWKTDGTLAGTEMVLDINPGEPGSDPKHLVAIGDTVYFSADNGTDGAELWMTDGTANGTKMVADIFLGAGNGSAPDMLKPFKGGLLFRAKDNISAADNDKSYLWWTDGTNLGTQMLHPIQPVMVPDGQTLTQIQVTGNGEKAFFVGLDDTTGQELWVTTGDTTKLVLDIGFDNDTSSVVPEATVDSDIRWLFAVNDEQVWFRVFTPSYWTNDSTIMDQFEYLDNEIWVTNGEPWGTYPIGDLNSVPDANDPTISGNTGAAFPFNFNGRTYFRANDGITNTEIHSTDLTFGDFPLLWNMNSQLNNGTDGPNWIEYFCIFNDELYFKAFVNSVDSAVTGLERVGQELFRYNPMEDKVYLVTDIFPGATTSSFPREMTVANNRMYFRANDANNQSNYELWCLQSLAEDSSRTAFKVAELPENTFPGSLTNFNEDLVFVSRNQQKLYIYSDDQALNVYDPGSYAMGPAVTDLENPRIEKPQEDTTTLSVNLRLDDYLNVYPNPATQVLNVTLDRQATSLAMLYSPAGRLVWKGELRQGSNQIQVGHLPVGVYALFTQIEGYMLPSKVMITR